MHNSHKINWWLWFDVFHTYVPSYKAQEADVVLVCEKGTDSISTNYPPQPLYALFVFSKSSLC